MNELAKRAATFHSAATGWCRYLRTVWEDPQGQDLQSVNRYLHNTETAETPASEQRRRDSLIWS